MIELKAVHKKFDGRGIAGINGVSLELRKGEVLAIMGPNGSGKTTLINLIAGKLNPDKGIVKVDGEARIFHGIEECEDMNVQKFLIWRNKHEIDEDKKLQLARDFADIFEFTFQLRQNISQLSAGQRQKVALASELVNRPSLLLLDEPFTHLDPHTRKDILKSLFTFIRHQEMSVLWVTHDLDEALRLSDRIGVLNYGKFEQITGPFELMERPRNLFVAQFLGYENFLPYGEKEILVVPDNAWLFDTDGASATVMGHYLKRTSKAFCAKMDEREIQVTLPRTMVLPPIGSKISLKPDIANCFTIPL